MKWIGYLLATTWRLWFLLAFIIVFISFMPLLFIFTSIYKDDRIICHLTRYWSKFTLWISFIFPKIEWEQELNRKDNYIFCANHTSTLDIPFILSVLPHPLQFMGKSEIANLPIFGYFYKNNSVIVDRANRKDSYSAFLKAGERLDKGLSMCIFPEGGIPDPEVLLKKFKNGPFRLAMEKQVKLVPITLFDNKKKFPQQYFKGYPGFVRGKVHKPVEIKDLEEKTIKNLNTLVYNIIFEELSRNEKSR